MDDSGLAHCVVFSCSNRPVDGGVYCANHVSLVPAPSPSVVSVAPLEEEVPAAPDMTAMEPEWDGENWILKPKISRPDTLDRLRRIQSLVRELMVECGIEEGG